jgi:hypothetical protein
VVFDPLLLVVVVFNVMVLLTGSSRFGLWLVRGLLGVVVGPVRGSSVGRTVRGSIVGIWAH